MGVCRYICILGSSTAPASLSFHHRLDFVKRSCWFGGSSFHIHLLASHLMSRARRLRDSLGLLAHDVNHTAFQQVWHVPSVVFEADFPLLGCLPLLKGTHTDFSTFLYAAFPSTLIFQLPNCSIWQTVESVFQNARAIILQWASACHEP
jgi:hypothetical protein